MEDQGRETDRPKEAGAQERGREGERAALLAAVLALSGEDGYRSVTVERLSKRAGLPVGQFYVHFAGKAECFAAAYAEQAPRLEAVLLDAGAAPAGWRDGLRATLGELFAFVTESSSLARAILTQVYVAQGEALARHEEALERLTRAVDRGRRETVASRGAPPPGTAAFMVGAIEASVRWRLEQGRPEALWEELPELMQLVVAAYLGDEAGRTELKRPDSAQG
jgi:AcrR family transcriptional regulator